VTGSSAGGLAAAYVAWKRPDLFGNVLSQSGAFWRGNEGSNDPPYEWLTGQYAAAPKRDIRFVLEVGALESQGALGGAAPSILEANRRLRDALRKKGYDVTYAEVPNGRHTPESWRERLPDAIAALARAPA
jgi:enterochelin esterase-like enzyme